MIVVDTSVWVDYFRGAATPQTERLDALLDIERILVGDIVLCEVLQGVPSEREATQTEAALRRFHVAPMLDPDLAIRAAAHYRRLRTKGITIRKTIDLIIGTFCIERRHELLHSDRDFEPMSLHLGLRTA
jgi:predicted nucleic acid-binding protein